MKTTKKHYPIDLGGLICFQKHIHVVSPHSTRQGIVKLVISVAGKPIGVRSTSLPMIWAHIFCLDVPVAIGNLTQLISDRLAEASWWDRVQTGDSIARQEHTHRYFPDGRPTGMAGLSIEMLKIPTRPELDEDPTYDP